MNLLPNWTELPEAKALLLALVEQELGWALAAARENDRLFAETHQAKRALMARLGLTEQLAENFRRRQQIEQGVRDAFRRAV